MREGFTSSADIELETSTTNIISRPSTSTSRRREPTCGRAAATMTSPRAAHSTPVLIHSRRGERSGISAASVEQLPKRARRRVLALCDSQNTSSIKGMAVERTATGVRRIETLRYPPQNKVTQNNSTARSSRASTIQRPKSSVYRVLCTTSTLLFSKVSI